MKVRELREELELYDGEMEVVVLDEERNEYEFEGLTLDHKHKEPTLALKYS